MKIAPYIRKVQFYETDQMAIVHHSNYIHWFEEARVDFMEQMGFNYERSMTYGIHIATIGVSCDYKSMFRFGDFAVISARLSLLTPARMTVTYEVTDKATGELRTTGETRHCYVSSEKLRPVSLKKEVPELYALFAAVMSQN